MATVLEWELLRPQLGLTNTRVEVIDPLPLNTCGPSEDLLCHDGLGRQEVRRLRKCPEASGIFSMDFKFFLRILIPD